MVPHWQGIVRTCLTLGVARKWTTTNWNNYCTTLSQTAQSGRNRHRTARRFVKRSVLLQTICPTISDRELCSWALPTTAAVLGCQLRTNCYVASLGCGQTGIFYLCLP